MTKIAWRNESENFCTRKKDWLTEKNLEVQPTALLTAKFTS